MSEASSTQNLFCDIIDLDNESDVEQAFARRLLESLGYPDRAIRTKATLEHLSVGKVAGDFHKPDFALKSGGHIRWVLEAKHPNENLSNHSSIRLAAIATRSMRRTHHLARSYISC